MRAALSAGCVTMQRIPFPGTCYSDKLKCKFEFKSNTTMPTLKKFSITGAAGNLEGIAHLPDELPRAIAVVAHPLPTMGGTMDNKVVTTLAKTVVELNFVALRFNFRGVGGSGGKFDEGDGEVEDVLTVVRDARQEYGNLPLILSGFSFGGYVHACA